MNMNMNMNHSAPDWNFDSDLPISNHRKLMGQDNGLVELLWENGQVVLNSQTHRKQVQKNHHHHHQQQQTLRCGTNSSLSYGNSSNLIQDDETVSWIHYPIEDSFEDEFCSTFFSDLPLSDPMVSDTNCNKTNRQLDHPQTTASNSQQQLNGHVNPMPPPKFQAQEENKTLEVKESSGMTVGPSYCGSNQVRNDVDFSRGGSSNCFGTTTTGLSSGTMSIDDAGKPVVRSEKGRIESAEPTFTSSSGGSGFNSSQKRKSRDGEDYECQSEAAAEHQSAATTTKPPQRSGLSRRTRAAEVHNLSERRRRDRINEKMKALKELIPHCNKTDKASMLDEAIEYLKSLQLQLQLMWMGNGMAPMMFPGMQHYMSRMGMGMGMGPPPTMTNIHNPMHLSQNQAAAATTPQTQQLNHVQNPTFSDQYARFLGFQHMQNAASHQMNMFGYGSQSTRQNPMVLPPTNSIKPATTNNTSPSGKMG